MLDWKEGKVQPSNSSFVCSFVPDVDRTLDWCFSNSSRLNKENYYNCNYIVIIIIIITIIIKYDYNFYCASEYMGSFAAVFSLVAQGGLRDETKNGCTGD